VEVNSSD
jgi:hypothetical protein